MRPCRTGGPCRPACRRSSRFSSGTLAPFAPIALRIVILPGKTRCLIFWRQRAGQFRRGVRSRWNAVRRDTPVLDAPHAACHNARMTPAPRQLGQSDLWVTPVALGCWPLAGITSGEMTEAAAQEVIHAALDAGINHLDTAYAYGRSGESEMRIARALAGQRDRSCWRPKSVFTGMKRANWD